jgi:hypothetical protein
MCKHVTVFPSFDKSNNELVVKILGRLKNIDIEYINDFGILDGVVKLPFIKTDEGECFFGVDSISKFVESQ